VSNRNDKASTFHWVWGYVTTNQLKGHYVEFGTYKGNTFIESWRQWKYFQKWMETQLQSNEKWRVDTFQDFSKYKPQFIGIDSFEGIPDNNESQFYFSQGDFAASESSVKKNCIDAGMPINQFQLIKSFYAEIPSDKFTSKAAVIHIDVDIYQSAIEALNLCKNIFQQGTVLLFDDYNCFSASNNQGERRALRDFTKETGIVFEPWFAYRNVGQAFLCHLK
jgi:hypothetical protein